ncbi:MAG: AMP-binding protein, partial [Mycobacteriales bacterium]
MTTEDAAAFRVARDLLLTHRSDAVAAYSLFRWPQLRNFNWALDHFDWAARQHPERLALWLVDDVGGSVKATYAQLSTRSGQVANWLRGLGVRRGDPILMMLPNRAELWELTLAAMKLGAVLIPSTTLLTPAAAADRVQRGGVRHVVADATCTDIFAEVPGDWTR